MLLSDFVELKHVPFLELSEFLLLFKSHALYCMLQIVIELVQLQLHLVH